MNKRQIVGAVATIAFAFVVFGWLDACQRVQAAEAEAEARQERIDVLRTERDELMDSLDLANELRARADAAAEQAELQLAQIRATADAEIQRARRAQDSIAAAIIAIVPDSVALMVEDLQEQHAAEKEQAAEIIMALTAMVDIRTAQLAAADQQLLQHDAVIVNLQHALALQVAQTETWKRAAKPGLLDGLIRDWPRLITAVGVGVVLGSALGG